MVPGKSEPQTLQFSLQVKIYDDDEFYHKYSCPEEEDYANFPVARDVTSEVSPLEKENRVMDSII